MPKCWNEWWSQVWWIQMKFKLNLTLESFFRPVLWLPLWNRKTKELTFVEHVFCARYWAGGRPTVSDVILKTEAQRHLNKLFRLIYLFADLRFRLCILQRPVSFPNIMMPVTTKLHSFLSCLRIWVPLITENFGKLQRTILICLDSSNKEP